MSQPWEVQHGPIIHVVPLDDLREHSSDIEAPCECLPRKEAAGTGLLVIHNSWDGREIGERAMDAVTSN